MIQRRDILVSIILTIVTCGIYGLYWYACIVNDINTLYGDPNAKSGLVVVLLTIFTCFIYGYIWAYRTGEKVDQIKTNRGIPAGNGGILYAVLFICTGGIIAYAIIQNEINNLA